ncbi:MAG: 4-hydroxybenzoate decarboxylase, partial [Vicinamibacterales bacterium]
LVTDRYVDVHNFKATLEHILARTNTETDLYVFSNLSMDTLDYTGPTVNEGSKGVWLGLGDPVRELPRQFIATAVPRGVADVRVFCAGCLVVAAPPYAAEPEAAARLATAVAFKDWPLVVVTDDATRATASAMNFLWTTFTRFEPAADIHAAERRIVRNHIAYRGPIAIDARLKPGFPKELTCRQDIAQRVTRRWKEYFPSGSVEMGDSERAHLD